MTKTLDQSLIFRSRRRVYPGQLTPEQAIAINLFWRKGVRAAVLARVFKVSKNTIYYRCLTGAAESYQDSPHSAKVALETNKTIEALGEKEAWKRYVTDKMVTSINREMETDVERKRA